MAKLGGRTAILLVALALACDRIDEIRERLLGKTPPTDQAEPGLSAPRELCESGEFDLAIEQLEAFTASHPSSADGYYNLGLCYLGKADGDVDASTPWTEAEEKARDGFAHALSLNPRHALASVGLGDLYLRRVPARRPKKRGTADTAQDPYQLAEEAYQKAVVIDPMLPEAQMHYARFLERTGEVQRAEQAFKAAAEAAAAVPEKAPDYYIAFGQFLARRSGRLEEAIDQYELAQMFRQDDLTIKREIATLYGRLGQEYFDKEQYSLAEQALNTAYTMFPDKNDSEAQKVSATLQQLSAMRGR